MVNICIVQIFFMDFYQKNRPRRIPMLPKRPGLRVGIQIKNISSAPRRGGSIGNPGVERKRHPGNERTSEMRVLQNLLKKIKQKPQLSQAEAFLCP